MSIEKKISFTWYLLYQGLLIYKLLVVIINLEIIRAKIIFTSSYMHI
jgi:hypothetical protein